LAYMARSWDLGQSILGTASINALSQLVIKNRMELYDVSEGGILESIRVRKEDTVVMVGYMRPIAERLRGRVKHLYILERNPQLRIPDAFPDTSCDDVLPRADIAIITGSSIPNKTIDRLLELSQPAREVCIVGPTAGIIPDVLFKHGATMVCCLKILNPELLIRIISEGGGTRRMKPAARFICIRPKGNKN